MQSCHSSGIATYNRVTFFRAVHVAAMCKGKMGNCMHAGIEIAQQSA